MSWYHSSRGRKGKERQRRRVKFEEEDEQAEQDPTEPRRSHAVHDVVDTLSSAMPNMSLGPQNYVTAPGSSQQHRNRKWRLLTTDTYEPR